MAQSLSTTWAHKIQRYNELDVVHTSRAHAGSAQRQCAHCHEQFVDGQARLGIFKYRLTPGWASIKVHFGCLQPMVSKLKTRKGLCMITGMRTDVVTIKLRDNAWSGFSAVPAALLALAAEFEAIKDDRAACKALVKRQRLAVAPKILKALCWKYAHRLEDIASDTLNQVFVRAERDAPILIGNTWLTPEQYRFGTPKLLAEAFQWKHRDEIAKAGSYAIYGERYRELTIAPSVVGVSWTVDKTVHETQFVVDADNKLLVDQQLAALSYAKYGSIADRLREIMQAIVAGPVKQTVWC